MKDKAHTVTVINGLQQKTHQALCQTPDCGWTGPCRDHRRYLATLDAEEHRAASVYWPTEAVADKQAQAPSTATDAVVQSSVTLNDPRGETRTLAVETHRLPENPEPLARRLSRFGSSGYIKVDQLPESGAATGTINKTEDAPWSSDTDEISDGFHTFGELYAHRAALMISLMMSHPQLSWFSLHHQDGSMYEGFFIAGMRLPTGQISYHLRMEPWYAVLQAQNWRIIEHENAPDWDGHTSEDALHRLTNWTLLPTWPDDGYPTPCS